MNIFFTRDPRGLLFRTPQSAHSRARTRVTVQHHVHAVKGIPIFHIACIGRYGHTRTFFCFHPSHTLPDEWTSTFDSTTLALATVFQCCTVVRRWADRASAPMGVSLDSPRSPTAGKVRSASIHASRVSASFLPFRVTHVARPNNKLPVCQKKLSSSSIFPRLSSRRVKNGLVAFPSSDATALPDTQTCYPRLFYSPRLTHFSLQLLDRVRNIRCQRRRRSPVLPNALSLRARRRDQWNAKNKQ